MQDHDQTAPSRPPDGALNPRPIREGFYIAQLVPGTDNTVIIIIAVLIIVIILAVLILKKALKARSAEQGRARKERLAYQPAVKPIPVATPVQVSGPVLKQPPVTPPVPDADFLENCQDFQQSLLALAGKYSLDSFTIATSDGLVFASTWGGTAEEDAAAYNGKFDGKEPAGMARFGLDYKGSVLTGIVRSRKIITGETKKCIERDMKDMLTKWI